jgi:hypothetical protein
MAGLVQLKTYNEFAEALVAKSKLEAHDIPVFLFDEHLGGNQFPPAAQTGFRLMVPQDCVEESARLLDTGSDRPE